MQLTSLAPAETLSYVERDCQLRSFTALARETMHKWLMVICPVVAFALVALLFALSAGKSHREHYILTQTLLIGSELVATTNSSRLLHPHPGLEKELAKILSAPSGVAELKLGDEPPPTGDGTACSRLVISNAIGGRLGVRLKRSAEPEKFHVLNCWTISASSTNW